MRFVSRRRAGVSSIVGSIFFVLIMIVAIGSLVTIFNSFTNYNSQVNKASNSNLQAADTQLLVTSGQFGAFPPSSPSSPSVATGCSTTSTFPTNRAKVFFTANMWWDFFTCNSAYQYSTSFDGVTWMSPRSIPSVITTGYTPVGPYFDVEVVGTSIYLAIAEKGAAGFQLGIGTLAYGGSNSAPAGTISWTDAPATVVAGATNAFGPINMAVDGAGNQWVAVVQGTCTTTINCAIALYEHQACATTSTTGWEAPAATCTTATAPTNYAPAALGTLSANTHTMIFPTPSTFGTTGAIFVYQTGSATNPSTGTLAVITQTALASAAWTTITLSGITDYSLTSSSADMIGGTLYFAGLANAAVGQTTGTLKFWTLAFTSMTAGTNTAEQTIESATLAWQAGLAISGTTLVLFDNPTTVAGFTCPCLQYYTSSTLGSIWNSPGIVLDSLGQDASQTAVNSLCPADAAFAVTWENTAGVVRFAALSSFVLTNNSPFGVHVVDLYIYNPATNTLVAHYYYNSTEDFDYWVGQGNAMTVPVRFIWSANTAYLITFSTDTGVTAQTTLTTLPGGTVSCSSGQFFSQISPYDVCGTAGSSTNPNLISGAGAATCTDTTSGVAHMMGFGLSYTTSASTSGNVFLSFAFQVTSPATSAITSTWQLYYAAGSSPACNAAATGTALGQAFVVKSQATVVRGLSQSISVTISGLAPSTTYWFDAQATDSSAAAWIYSNPDMALTEAQSTNSPALSTSTNANTCTDGTSGVAHMMGFATTFTTGGTGFSGSVFGKLTFNEAGPATSAINTKYTVAYGTGTAPACNAAASGTTAGEQYTVASQAGVASGASQKVGFELNGLAASTTYWVDVQALDSSAAAWVYSLPVLAVMNMPSPTNSLPNVGGSASTATCNVVSANTLKMAGFAAEYNIPSSAGGNLYLTLTFQVTIPAVSGDNTQWQLAWDDGAPPTCNAPATGYTPGNTYTVTSQAGVAGGVSQSETFVIQDLQKVAGTTIWVDVQVYDSTTDTWTFSNPTLSVAIFPQ